MEAEAEVEEVESDHIPPETRTSARRKKPQVQWSAAGEAQMKSQPASRFDPTLMPNPEPERASYRRDASLRSRSGHKRWETDGEVESEDAEDVQVAAISVAGSSPLSSAPSSPDGKQRRSIELPSFAAQATSSADGDGGILGSEAVSLEKGSSKPTQRQRKGRVSSAPKRRTTRGRTQAPLPTSAPASPPPMSSTLTPAASTPVHPAVEISPLNGPQPGPLAVQDVDVAMKGEEQVSPLPRPGLSTEPPPRNPGKKRKAKEIESVRPGLKRRRNEDDGRLKIAAEVADSAEGVDNMRIDVDTTTTGANIAPTTGGESLPQTRPQLQQQDSHALPTLLVPGKRPPPDRQFSYMSDGRLVLDFRTHPPQSPRNAHSSTHQTFHKQTLDYAKRFRNPPSSTRGTIRIDREKLLKQFHASIPRLESLKESHPIYQFLDFIFDRQTLLSTPGISPITTPISTPISTPFARTKTLVPIKSRSSSSTPAFSSPAPAPLPTLLESSLFLEFVSEWALSNRIDPAVTLVNKFLKQDGSCLRVLEENWFVVLTDGCDAEKLLNRPGPKLVKLNGHIRGDKRLEELVGGDDARVLQVDTEPSLDRSRSASMRAGPSKRRRDEFDSDPVQVSAKKTKRHPLAETSTPRPSPTLVPIPTTYQGRSHVQVQPQPQLQPHPPQRIVTPSTSRLRTGFEGKNDQLPTPMMTPTRTEGAGPSSSAAEFGGLPQLVPVGRKKSRVPKMAEIELPLSSIPDTSVPKHIWTKPIVDVQEPYQPVHVANPAMFGKRLGGEVKRKGGKHVWSEVCLFMLLIDPSPSYTDCALLIDTSRALRIRTVFSNISSWSVRIRRYP